MSRINFFIDLGFRGAAKGAERMTESGDCDCALILVPGRRKQRMPGLWESLDALNGVPDLISKLIA
jgi:hypothetical protein